MTRRFASSIFLLSLSCVTSIFAADSDNLWTIGFGSCNHQSRWQGFWTPILNEKPDIFIFCGDNIYGDTKDEKVMQAKYNMLLGQPGFQSLRKESTVLATWDDHDYGQNDAGADYVMKEASEKLFEDVWNFPENSPARFRPGIYDAHVFEKNGKRLQVILLDTRYFRSPIVRLPEPVPNLGQTGLNTDPKATMLGEDQWSWLKEQLEQPADIRILVSSIQVVAGEHFYESWSRFPLEQEKLYALIRDTKAQGVVMISGDRHHGEISMNPDAVGYPLYDATSSGLNMARRDKHDEPNQYRVGNLYLRSHFGMIRISDEDDPLITLQVTDVRSKVQCEASVRLSDLKSN